MTEPKKIQIFVPGNYVPLSPFYYFENNAKTGEISVLPEILTYILDHHLTVFVAFYDGEKVDYMSVDNRSTEELDTHHHRVSFALKESGTYTLVSDAFINAFPVVTHWDKTLHNGTGGFCVGASDGPGNLDVNLANDEILSHLPFVDTDPSNPLYYKTDKYNLMSSPGETEHFLVPAYERYIGEGFSLMQVSDTLAVWLSDKCLNETGYPLIYHNYPEYELKENCPAFQIVLNEIAAYNHNAPSLATYILPPFWTASPDKPYPVLFTGFYDSNDNFFKISGSPFLKIIGDTYNEIRCQTIGIIWNGGGSSGTRTFQLSAYHNLSVVFDIAKDKFGGDSSCILAYGGSRGGISALAAAGNPYHDNYRVQYVVAYNPILKFGDPQVGFVNPTCPMLYDVLCIDTGYKYAWRKEWRDPDTNLPGGDLLLTNLIGTASIDIANEVLSPFSGQFAKAMKERGTQVFLYSGTHDAFNTKDSIIELAENMLSHGVEVHLRLGYRFGHGNVENIDWHAKDLLIAMIRGDKTFKKGMSHYKRASLIPEEWQKSEPFFPSRQPVFFEAPKKIARGDWAKINIVGSAGMRCHLKLIKLEDAIWLNEKKAVGNQKDDAGFTLFEGPFEHKTQYLENGISYISTLMALEQDVDLGWYLYELWYQEADSGDWHKLACDKVPQPGVETLPVMEVLGDYPMVSGNEWAGLLGIHCIGWGLSEY